MLLFESSETQASHGRKLLQTSQETFLFTECDCEAWLCNPGYYQRFSFETNCWGCVECPTKCEAGFFRGGPCNPFSSPCKPCTVCSSDQIVAEPCGDSSDTVCYECRQCIVLQNSTDCQHLIADEPVTGNMTNNSNITVTTPPPVVIDPVTEAFCRFCPRLPAKAFYTGQFDASGVCGFQCEPPLFLTETGECSCGSGFLNETAQECQECLVCPEGYARECNATSNAICFPCVNTLPALCAYNGTFNATTGICDITCEEPECLDCLPGTVRPDDNCTIPCEACSTILPANTKFSVGCDYVCEDNYYFARGRCNPCTVCTLGQYLNAPCQPTQDTDCRNCPNQQLPPFSEYTGVFDQTKLECSIRCTGSATLSADGQACGCPPGRYVNSSIQCAPCGMCQAGYWEAAPCSLQADTLCNPCSTCEFGTFTNASCTANADTLCQPCSECAEGTFPNATCAAESDTLCLSCATCEPDKEYQTVPCRRGVVQGNTECADCTVCALGEYETRPCNATADRQCTTCNSTKPAGSEWTGGFDKGECTWECSGSTAPRQAADGSYSCSGCKDGFFRQSGVCQPCSECTVLGEFESSPCNATSDAVCSSCVGKPAEADFTETAVGTCTWECRVGWHRVADTCQVCTGAPPNSAYTGTYDADLGECVWTCITGFEESADRKCLCASGTLDSATGQCVACGVCNPDTQIEWIECNATFPGVCIVCPNAKPAQSTYTGDWDGVAGECEWECDSGWTLQAAAGVMVSGNASCYECTTCSLGSYESTACNSQTNTVCRTCPNQLPADAEWTGTYSAGQCGWTCPAFSTYSAGDDACLCNEGYRRGADRSCVPCLVCDLGLKVLEPCNDLNDTICASCINFLPNNSYFDGAVDPVTADCSWTCRLGWTYYEANITIYPTTTTPPPPNTTTSTTTTPEPTTSTTSIMETPVPNSTNDTASFFAPTTPPPDTVAEDPTEEPRVGIQVLVEGCEPCIECQPGTFVHSPCAQSPPKQTECAACPNGIPPGALYQLELDGRGFCTYTCPEGASCTCGDGSWWDDSGFGECKPCTVCAPGVYQVQECQVWADTVCATCPNDPPQHEVFNGAFDEGTGECITVCREGWDRYDPSQSVPGLGGNASMGNQSLASNGTNGTMALPPPVLPPVPTLPEIEPIVVGNGTLRYPCICLDSKIETPDGGCDFCSECQPGTLLSKVCNASGNEDTQCRPCPNTKPVGSDWVPGTPRVTGTFLGPDNECVWTCKEGLTPVEQGDETLCLCLGKPASCGYCPVLPGNATVIGSWCSAYQYLFDGSCRQSEGRGVRMNLIFRWTDWSGEAFGQKVEPFQKSVMTVLRARLNQMTIATPSVGRRSSPLTVPTFLTGVPIPNLLEMLANPDRVNALFAANDIPPATMMLGNSTVQEAEVAVEENITVAERVVVVEEDTVATPTALIMGIIAGFAGLLVSSVVGYFLCCRSKDRGSKDEDDEDQEEDAGAGKAGAGKAGADQTGLPSIENGGAEDGGAENGGADTGNGDGKVLEATVVESKAA